MGSRLVRVLVGLGVGFLQFVAALIVTFGVSLAIPQMNPDTNKGLFVAVAGFAFVVGIVAIGLLAVRLGWLAGGPSYGPRIGLAMAGVYVPLVVALLAGQVREASPFLTLAIVAGVVGFQAGGWIGHR